MFLAGLYWEFVVDDAYITFRYAVHYIAHLPGRLGRRIDTDYILSQKPDLIILLSEVAPPADFKGLTPIDQALYEAVIRRQEYALHSVCQFNERYYLWVIAHQRGRWMQRPSD